VVGFLSSIGRRLLDFRSSRRTSPLVWHELVTREHVTPSRLPVAGRSSSIIHFFRDGDLGHLERQYRAWLTTFAPILISFSLSIVVWPCTGRHEAENAEWQRWVNLVDCIIFALCPISR
jgi:hypothetical protein